MMKIDLFLALFFGVLIAWLTNYLSDVLPQTRRLSQPRCTHCRQTLPWGVYLRLGDCPHCGQKTSRRHRIVLLIVTLVSAWVWLHPSADTMPAPAAAGWGRVISLILVLYFSVVFIIDAEYRVVLDEVSLFGAALMAGLGIWLHGWQTTLLGGLGGFLMMYAFYGLGVLYLRWKNRHETVIAEDNVALGFGDVKLAAVLGLLLGWPAVLAMLLLAFLLGGIVGLVVIIILLAKKQPVANAAMPYAPFLILITAYILLL